MEKKYQILKNDYIDIRHPESKKSEIVRVYRIIAMKDFGGIRSGQIGGYIQGEDNLSHDGNCWVDQWGKVFDRARISDDAIVTNNAAVFGGALVSGISKVTDYARVRGNAIIIDSEIKDKSDVRGNAKLTLCTLMNSSLIYEDAEVFNTVMTDGSMIHGMALVSDSTLSDVSEVRGNTTIRNSKFGGRSIIETGVHENATITRDIELAIETGKGER